MKIKENVSFNIASEASYIYIFSGRKFIKNSKKGSILASFRKHVACTQTVLPDKSILIVQKLEEMPKIQNSTETFCAISNNVEFINFDKIL